MDKIPDNDFLWEVATNHKIQQIREEWQWLIETVFSGYKKEHVIDIGAYDGGTTSYLSYFAQNLTTIDNNIPTRITNAADFCQDCNWTLVEGDSHSASIVRDHIQNSKWDFAFIDGDHSYEGVQADYNNVVAYMSPGSAIAFHDVVISDYHHRHKCFVGEFWRDLKSLNLNTTQEFTTNSEWGGIGIIWIK